MNLQDSLNRLKTKIEANIPAEFVEIMHKATAELENSGIGNNILKVGDKAPEFSLPNQDDEMIFSQDLIKNSKLILTFYRGVWCPYCNTDLSFLKRYQQQFQEVGAKLISVSPELPKYNKQIIEQQKLGFDLLSDAGNELAAKFGLRWEMVDPLKNLYKNQFGLQLPEYNGDDSWTLPVPARFIINQEGIIEYVEYSVDYTKRPDPETVLNQLK